MSNNTSIADLRAANPYRNQVYNKSPWQKFLSGLGFRTEADAWQENMSVQAAEYDSALAQKEFDTNYDSASAQADRMRAAGLNPDIDPSSISPGNAASMGEDPSTPMQSSGDEQQLMSVANTIVSCFSTALGLVSSVQGIQRNSLSNHLLSLQSDEQVADFASKLAPTFLRQPGQNGDMKVQDYLDDAFERAKLFSRRNLPRKFRSKFNSAIENFFSSAPGESSAYRSWYDTINNEKNYFGSKNEFYSPSPETMDIIYKHLGAAREQLALLGMKKQGSEDSRDISSADYDSSMISGLSPDMESAAKNAEFGARKNQADVTNILRGSVNGILSDLKNDTSEFGGFFRFLLSCYSLYMFSR